MKKWLLPIMPLVVLPTAISTAVSCGANDNYLKWDINDGGLPVTIPSKEPKTYITDKILTRSYFNEAKQNKRILTEDLVQYYYDSDVTYPWFAPEPKRDFLEKTRIEVTILNIDSDNFRLSFDLKMKYACRYDSSYFEVDFKIRQLEYIFVKSETGNYNLLSPYAFKTDDPFSYLKQDEQWSLDCFIDNYSPGVWQWSDSCQLNSKKLKSMSDESISRCYERYAYPYAEIVSTYYMYASVENK